MMIKLQRLFKRTIIIFGITTLLQMILGTSLNNKGLYDLLALSFAISIVQSLLFQDILFNYSIPRQVAFLLLVWGMVIGANYLFGWNYHVNNLILLLGIVLLSYLGIRLITYYQIKDEAKEMNLFLKNLKDKI
jgi:hypothetical protein